MKMATRYWMKLLTLSTAAGLSTAHTTSGSLSEQCMSFGRALDLPSVTVNVAEFVANGTNLTFPDNVETSNASRITLEAWLPPNSSWNGRFLSTGNSGIGGCIRYDDIAYANSFGFAAVGANNGHNGTGGTAFAESPEVIKDFAWRSVHTGVVLGKKITNQFYGHNFSHSYYLGCSTGGRQGFKMAQDFPDDFGAPALDLNGLSSWSGHLTQLAGFDRTSSTFITKQQWSLIHSHILAQCDALDGATDGIIENPDLCHPIFSALLCPSNTTNNANSTCLNPDQVRRAAAIFSPFYGLNGTLIYPRMQPGSELAAYSVYYAGRPFAYTTDWFRYAVLNDSTWDPRNQSLQDAAYAEQLNLFDIATWKGDLSTFRDTGGKILTYHGMQDQVITSENSARYYAHVANTMALPPNELDHFYRYFRISGMSHCGYGPGATDIGQGYAGRPSPTAQDNVLLAIMAWVENATAPEYVRGYTTTASMVNGSAYSRRHCRYPTRNMYVGPGNYTDESAWQCVT